jgi:aspartate racemase
VSNEIIGMRLKKVALLGTRFTMSQDFYKGRIKDKYGIDVIVPNEEDKNVIHDVIYKELVKGIFKESSKKKYIEIIQKLIEQGAEGIILGCTEIPLLIKQQDVNIPIFDTASIHARAAVKYALEQ